jgi:AraC-like DNA-binding protein
MARLTKGELSPDSLEDIEKRKQLARMLVSHAPTAGEHSTQIPELTLFHRTALSSSYCDMYEPSLNLFVQGSKSIKLRNVTYQCDESCFLLSSIDVPVQSEIVAASRQTPLLCLILKLDISIVREVLSQEDLPPLPPSRDLRGLAVGKSTPDMVDACVRLVELLATPDHIPFLSPLIQREIIYRLLRTPQASRLRAIATSGDPMQRAARAIAWLKKNYTKQLHIEELAEVAGMAVSTLHHQFRALTTMTPLQYQKQLRLQAARKRMLMDGLDGTSAAYEVGYESVSQFNREYSRFYGLPPMRDIKALRERFQLENSSPADAGSDEG